MSLSTFQLIVGPGLAWGSCVAILLLALVATIRKALGPRAASALVALAMASGFVAGYCAWFEVPNAAKAEIWRWPVVSAGIAGAMMFAALMLPAKWRWAAMLAAVAGTTWITVRRFPDHPVHEIAVLAGVLAAYLAAAWPILQHGRPWATGVLAVMLPAATLAAFVFPPDMNVGQMLMLLTALAAVAIAAGAIPWTRAAAAGAVAFLALMYGVLVTLAAFYNESYPAEMFHWFRAAPMAMGVAWIIPLRNRPWLCAIIASLIAAAIVARGTMLAAPVLQDLLRSAG